MIEDEREMRVPLFDWQVLADQRSEAVQNALE